MIPIIEETKDTRSPFMESCVFCDTPTYYWNNYSNNPVCKECAKVHEVAELKDYGLPYRNKKRREQYKLKKENK